MQLYRLDSSQSPNHGGVLCIFPSGARKQVTWTHQGPIPDPRTMAKNCVAALVDHMGRANLVDDLERTNLVSAVAAVERIVKDFNDTWTKLQAAG